jgi:HAD superfamily hydrolase (TIGR01509 family)
MIKALIFDFDGLILDTESPEFQAWQELFSAHGHELPADLWADLIGRPRTYFDMYAHFKKLNGPRTDVDALRKDRRARVVQLVLEQPILPGVTNCLTEAKEMGLKIGLASSSGGDYVRGHLRRLELFDYFHVTKCFEDTELHKPNPEPYLAVLDAMGVSPGEAIAFEDSPNGVAAARAAGIYCVAVPNPMTACLSLAHADLCLKSLADESLPQLLSRASGTPRVTLVGSRRVM